MRDWDDYSGSEDEELFEILTNGRLALKRLINLLELAQTAKTKEEAEQFIKELELADYQAKKALEPKGNPSDRNIKKSILNAQGDFAKLTKLYISLGAV